MKKITVIVLLLAISFGMRSYAQIGYQVSLLNSATGVPRANETVSVTVEITDSKDNVICSKTQDETTNDFGILSLSVGNENTFKNVDWNNLPMYISVTVDDILVGKSQILSVPEAEHAKHAGSLNNKSLLTANKQTLTGEWNFSPSSSDLYTGTYSYKNILNSDGEFVIGTGQYLINGDVLIGFGKVTCYEVYDKVGGGYAPHTPESGKVLIIYLNNYLYLVED